MTPAGGAVRISKHFTLSEALYSATALDQGIDNTPDDQALVYMALTAHILLEELRSLWGGAPLRVSSFYRSWALNDAVGGSEISAHMQGRAVDIPAYNGLTLSEMLQVLIATGIPYDKAIIEHGKRSSWLHIQIARIGARPRRKVLSAQYDPTSKAMIYSNYTAGSAV